MALRILNGQTESYYRKVGIRKRTIRKTCMCDFKKIFLRIYEIGGQCDTPYFVEVATSPGFRFKHINKVNFAAIFRAQKLHTERR